MQTWPPLIPLRSRFLLEPSSTGPSLHSILLRRFAIPSLLLNLRLPLWCYSAPATFLTMVDFKDLSIGDVFEPVKVLRAQNCSSSATIAGSTQPFPFARLPKDIRRLVYDYLPVREYRALLDTEHGLYYEARSVPVALLRVNKFFHEEVKACLHEHLQAHPIVILCRQSFEGYAAARPIDAARYANVLIRLIDDGHEYDNFHRRRTGTSYVARSQAQDFDRWTLKVPMLRFEATIRRICSEHYQPLVRFLGPALQSFYETSLLKLRRNPAWEINVRWYLKHPAVTDKNEASLKNLVSIVSSCFGSRRHLWRFFTVLDRKGPSRTICINENQNERWQCLVEIPTEEEVGLLGSPGENNEDESDEG